MNQPLSYSHDAAVSPEQFVDLLRRSTLAERRPVDDPGCISAMLAHADLLVSAWRGAELVGVARSVTDFAYCCYLSDLAVDRDLQRRGVGRELVARTRAALGPGCRLILLAAPAAEAYYPRLGFERHPSAWTLAPGSPLAPPGGP